MQSLRSILSWILASLLMLGYLASQVAYLKGDAFGYTTRVDQPAMKWLALVLFVACILFTLVGDREKT